MQQSNVRYYLAGKMSGVEDFNRPTFHRIARELRDQGYIVWNPAELQIEGDDYHEYQREGLSRLVECNAVILIPGWETSHGTKAELLLARILHMPIYQYGHGTLRDVTKEIHIHYTVQPMPLARGDEE